MGMSTHVVGFKPPDDKWRRMKAVYDACEAAGLETPHEVEMFFEEGRPDPAGVEIERAKLIDCGALRTWSGEYGEQGYELDVTKLPKDVIVVRFYNSW